MTPSTFRRFERMHGPGAFSRARREGRRKTGQRLVLWARLRGEEPPRATRLGLVVGRRHGSAVERNLFKRRLREAFRQNKDLFPRGWDLVVTPKTPEKASKTAFPPPYRDLMEDFLALAGSAGKP